jgi:hypothetical protein
MSFVISTHLFNNVGAPLYEVRRDILRYFVVLDSALIFVIIRLSFHHSPKNCNIMLTPEDPPRKYLGKSVS